jgi:tetratricopeptide (TPR) repeat protein
MGERALQVDDLEHLEGLSQRLGAAQDVARVWVMFARYYFHIGDFPESARHASRVASLDPREENVEVILDGYSVWPLALLRLGNLQEAMQRAHEGLSLAERSGKRIQEGYILNSMGLIALEQREPAFGHHYLERALAIARETGERELEARSLNNLANSAGFVQGDYAAARDYYQQAYLLVHERGDRSGEGIALANLGWASGLLGDFSAARAFHERALSVSREVGNRYQETYTLVNLSAIAEMQGEAPAAMAYARQANELARRIGERSGEAWSMLYIGHAFLLTGDFAWAREAFQQSVSIREELGQSGLAVEAVSGLVQAALGAKNLPAALDWTEKILSHLANGGTFEATDSPLRIYHVCYQALETLKDPRAMELLREAASLLDAQVAKILDDEARRMFVENVPWRRAIQEAWETRQAQAD